MVYHNTVFKFKVMLLCFQWMNHCWARNNAVALPAWTLPGGNICFSILYRHQIQFSKVFFFLNLIALYQIWCFHNPSYLTVPRSKFLVYVAGKIACGWDMWQGYVAGKIALPCYTYWWLLVCKWFLLRKFALMLLFETNRSEKPGIPIFHVLRNVGIALIC